MADLTIAGTVKKVSGSTVTDRGVAGVTISAGKSLYKDLTNSDKLALADADTEAASIFEGIALHDAVADQPIEYATGGLLDMGTTVVVIGQSYVVSTTAGGIAPYGDLASGDYPSHIGFGKTATRIEIVRNRSRVPKA